MGVQTSRFPEQDEFSAGVASLQVGGSGSYKMRDMVGGKSSLMYVNSGACRWTLIAIHSMNTFDCFCVV